jgi:hypothetical protein
MNLGAMLRFKKYFCTHNNHNIGFPKTLPIFAEQSEKSQKVELIT